MIVELAESTVCRKGRQAGSPCLVVILKRVNFIQAISNEGIKETTVNQDNFSL